MYPDTQTVDVVRSLQNREHLTIEDTIDFGDVLPGFSLRVAEIFG